MRVIRRGLLAAILLTPLVFAASVASTPASRADSSCNNAGASTGGGEIQTFVCLAIDSAPAKPEPLSTAGGDDGPPLVCWLEPQYTPAGLQSLITTDAGLSESQVGEGGYLYNRWKINYGTDITPAYRGGEDGWWWGVGCDTSNLNAYTYEEQLWSEVGLDVFHPWEWVAAEKPPANAPAGDTATPSLLAEYAREAATLDQPSGQMSPTYANGASTQTVGLPTYFWGQIGDGAAPVAQHTITASVQWLSSTVTAVPETVTITTTGATKGPSTITCPVTGGTFGTDNTDIPSDCSFTYTEPSTDITVTMVTNWQVTWPGADGVAGWTKDANSQTVTFGGITVQEVQTINNGGSAAASPTS